MAHEILGMSEGKHVVKIDGRYHHLTDDELARLENGDPIEVPLVFNPIPPKVDEPERKKPGRKPKA